MRRRRGGSASPSKERDSSICKEERATKEWVLIRTVWSGPSHVESLREDGGELAAKRKRSMFLYLSREDCNLYNEKKGRSMRVGKVPFRGKKRGWKTKNSRKKGGFARAGTFLEEEVVGRSPRPRKVFRVLSQDGDRREGGGGCVRGLKAVEGCKFTRLAQSQPRGGMDHTSRSRREV